MSLFLIKHSRPDIAKAVLKCTKVLDGATKYAFCEMLCIIKYVFNTKGYRLRIDPIYKKNKLWDLVCYSYSNNAGDNDTRQSVSGLILYVTKYLSLGDQRPNKVSNYQVQKQIG